MAASPSWKVYDSLGKYVAACKDVEAAASLMGFYGEGATIRFQHTFICWTQGKDGDAMESYDTVADTCFARMREYNNKLRHFDNR